MEIFKSIVAIREFLRLQREAGNKIGLVPTMGYFHEGHLSLMRLACKECNTVVVSIFVNPIQFGEEEDYGRYPRNWDRDLELALSTGVDAIFSPEVEEMFPHGYATYVEVENLTEGLCGRFRPGHFRGVATIVAKLFNIIQPDKAYFGRKDVQQALVIQRMVRDLHLPLEIVLAPIVREKDGLALSSRNVYLSPEERSAALVLNRSLKRARSLISAGEREVEKVLEEIQKAIREEPRARAEYVEIRKMPDLTPLNRIEGSVLIALAVWIGNTRLIDNTVMEVLNGADRTDEV